MISETELVNVHFDPTKPLELYTDASIDGIAGLLVQDGNLIYAVSRTMKPEEKRYSTIERELLAVVWSLQRLRDYIHGRTLTIYTDHKPLVGLMEQDSFTSERLMRLGSQLLDFHFDIQYIKGIDNPADFLSRNSLDEVYTYRDHKVEGEEIWVKTHRDIWKRYIASTVERRKLIARAHGERHGGKSKMLAALEEWTWPCMEKDVLFFLDTCICSLMKENRKRRTKRVNIPSFNPADKIGLIAADLYSFEGKTYLTVMDVETRDLWILPVEDKSSPEVKRMFLGWWDSMPRPFRESKDRLLTDRGGRF